MDQWLIRTEQNKIAGPYTKEQVSKMILEGQLGLEDEVCSGTGYWIYLHEANEVREQLGLTVPRQGNVDGPTQATFVDDDATDTSLETPSLNGAEMRLKELTENMTESTGVIDASVFRELKTAPPTKKTATASQLNKQTQKASARPTRPIPSIEVKGQGLEPLNWQKAGLILLAIIGFLVGLTFLFRFKK